MTDRKIAPYNFKLSQPDLMHPHKIKTTNGNRIYAFNAPGCKVIQIEWVFGGGLSEQKKALQSSFTGQLLTEGTKSYPAQTISQTVDFYGASLQVDTEIHNQTLTLNCTKESLGYLLPLLGEMISCPLFSEKEFNIHCNTAKERHKVNIKKVDYIARKHFNANLYGVNHVLGKPLVEEDYDNITPGDLRSFFESQILGKLDYVIAAGDLDDKVISDLSAFVAGIGHRETTKNYVDTNILKTNRHFIKVENAVQSAIRIGFTAIPRKHDDFPALQVVNMLLGGYFGSRLMSNIREDKGYTYGIGSSVVPLPQSAYLVIATEVGANVTEAAIKEIHKEIRTLCEKPVPAEELELARNYLIGSFIRNSDGVFAMADRFKALLYSDLDYAYYDHYFNVIENINTGEIMKVAREYLDRPYVEIIAGGN